MKFLELELQEFLCNILLTRTRRKRNYIQLDLSIINKIRQAYGYPFTWRLLSKNKILRHSWNPEEKIQNTMKPKIEEKNKYMQDTYSSSFVWESSFKFIFDNVGTRISSSWVLSSGFSSWSSLELNWELQKRSYMQ